MKAGQILHENIFEHRLTVGLGIKGNKGDKGDRGNRGIREIGKAMLHAHLRFILIRLASRLKK